MERPSITIFRISVSSLLRSASSAGRLGGMASEAEKTNRPKGNRMIRVDSASVDGGDGDVDEGGDDLK